MATNSRVELPKACAPQVAQALQTFSDHWEPYSIKSRRYSIYRLVHDVVDPAWAEYLETLPFDHAGRTLCGDWRPGEFARAFGFRCLEDRIIAAIHEYSHHCDFDAVEADETFDATLEAIRELAVRCRIKQPKREQIGALALVRNLNGRRAQVHCEFCGQLAELEAFRRDQSRWSEDVSGTRRFSSRYCAEHRPMLSDGTHNPAYKRAIRQKKKFERELTRLNKQAHSVAALMAQTGDSAVDRFFLNIVATDGIYPDEEGLLRNIANNLVEKKMSDRKKQIVSLIASGMKPAEVARQIDISRQAVGKALHSVPKIFRFDTTKSSSVPMQIRDPSLQEKLGEVISEALQDSEVLEILLNPDGRMWANHIDDSMIEIGRMSPEDATDLVEWIAISFGICADHANSIVEGDILEGRARFAAFTPPIVENPTFAIRKKRSDVFNHEPSGVLYSPLHRP